MPSIVLSRARSSPDLHSDLEDQAEAVVKSFFDTLNPDEQKLFEATTLSEQLLEDVKRLDAAHKDNSRSRKCSAALKPFLTGVLQYGKALDVLANSTMFVSPIWGSARVVLHLAYEFGEYFDRLTGMFEEIGRNLTGLRRYPKLYPNNKILQESMVKIFKKIFEFCSKAKRVFKAGKTRSASFKAQGHNVFNSVGLRSAMKLVWKPFKEQFGDIKAAICAEMDAIENEVDIAEKELANEERAKAETDRQEQEKRWKRAEALADVQSKQLDRVESMQTELTTYIDEQSIASLQAWLAPSNVRANHAAATKLRHGTTGSWFLAGDAFQFWLSTPNSFLWLSAIPGAGKTVLASSVINYLRDNVQSKQRGVAYFYCDYKEPHKQQPSNLLATLLSMLGAQNQSVFRELESFFQKQAKENPGVANSTPGFDELRSNFSTFIGDYFDEVLIVVDALDECIGRDCITHGLMSLVRSCPTLKVFVTSRNEIDIYRAFEDLPKACIQKEDVAEDIENFVRFEVSAKIKDRKLKLRDPRLEQTIVSALTEGAQGMFQWVKCQIDHLSKQRNDKAIRESLKKLPKTLDDVYIRILQRIEEESDDDIGSVRRLLRWLVRGFRTMSLDELAECISIDTKANNTSMDLDAVITDPEDILELCSSLVTLSADRTKVALAHYSVKEFLVSTRVRDSLPTFWVANEEVESELATTCLTYLCYDDFSDGVCALNDVPNQTAVARKLEEYKFLQYAAQFWAVHAHRSAEHDEDLQTLIMRFFHPKDEAKNNYCSWLQVYHYRKTGRPSATTYNHPPLFFAASFGLANAVKGLLEECDVDHEKTEHDPLQAAAFGGHVEVVKILLEHYDHEKDKNLALYAAASKGHAKVVELLLDEGAAINSKGGKQGSALQIAVLEGYKDVVELLLRRNADTTVSCKRFGTPLAAAAEKAHTKTFELLLEAGANVNGKGGWYGFPLVSAIIGKNMDLVDALLENAADVNAFGGRHDTAIMAASSLGMLDLVRKLIECGAKVNDENDKGSDALYAACVGGHLEVVELLLESGADVNAKGGKHRNALNAASAEGQVAIVSKLIEAGADVKVSDEHYGNALQSAAHQGKGDVVRILAEAGVDVNAEGGVRGSALVSAASSGQIETIRILFELGVPAENTEDMSNALMMAAWKQHEDCCRLLVESGADINSTGTRNKETRTPLQAAASKGNLSLVKALLELGADVNLLGGDKGSTLLAAIDNDRRNPEVVKVLLDNGANVDEKVSPSVISYGFALGAAVGNRDLSITRLLIDGGADVNLLNAHYKSSIQLASSCDDPSFLDLLLEHGGDINLVTKPSDPFYDGEITPLQEAVWAEKETNVQRLLSLGANLSVDVEKSRFKSALQVAAYKGYSSLVKILIEAGSDVNEEGGEDGTALQAATEDGHTEVVRILLDNKANANERKCGQYGSALLCAAQKNHLEIARLLIEHGADPNVKAGPPYQYPLQAAAYFELEDMVTLLLDMGADVNSRGGQWGTALQAAAVDGSHDVMKILVDRGANVDIQAGFYGNALGAAYRHGYYYCTGLLYEHNVNNSVATRSRYGSPMGSALQGGACQTLLNQLVRYHNVNVNLAYGKYGNPLQHCIVMEREQVIFEAIIDYGANLNAIGGRYGTALNATLVDNHLDQAQYLLGKGADLNVRGNALYYSPLQCAIRGKSMDSFNAMLEKGCDVSEIGGHFGSPLQLAAFTGQIKMVKELVRRGATVNTTGAGHYGCALIAAAIRGHEDIVRYLLKKGADVSARGSPFGSFFHCAVLCLSRDIIELCLRRGVPVNLKAGVFCTPLQAAASRGNVSIVLLLLAHGADITIRGGKYNTALQAAGAYGDQEVCKILIERGADVNTKGGMHKTPLQAAATCRQADTVKVLLDNGAEWKLCDRSVGRVHSQAYDWADEILNKAVEQPQEDDGDEEWEDEEEEEDEVEAEGEEEEIDGKEDVGEDEDGNEGDAEEEIEEEPLEMNVESIPDFEKEYIPPPPAPESISVPEPTSSVEVTNSTSCATVPAEPESSQDHGQESHQPQSSTSGPSSNASPSPPMSPVKPTRTKSNPLVTQLEVQPSSDEDAGTTDRDEAWNELAWLQVTCGWGGDLAGPGRETD